MDQHGDSGGHGNGGEGASMSPHEIEDLQRKNCVFCHISAGKVPARKVYEDNECLAVLDINPATPGHMLLMPKEHYTVMSQVPEQVLGHIFVIAKGLSQAVLKAFQTKGTTIFAANGVAAGQRAPHFMLHIIPRDQGDNAGLYIPSRALGTKEAEQIATALSATLGYTAPVVTDAHRPKVDRPEVDIAASERQPSTHSEEKKEGEKHDEERAEAATAEAKESQKEKKHDEKEEGHAKHAADEEKNDLDSITDFLAGSKMSKGGGGKP